MRALISVALILLLVACGSSTSTPPAPLTTIQGEWVGTITSTVYEETESVILSVGPKNETADNHTAVFRGSDGASLERTVYCSSEDLVDMTCYRFGLSYSWSILMEGKIVGRTWTGDFSFSDPTFGPDQGTFRFVKR